MSEPLKLRPFAVGPACWDYIAAKTGTDRWVCKSLIYNMLYGGPVISTCKNSNLRLESAVEIRVAFDDFIEGRPLDE
jgi:hypothetical protein